MKQRTIIASVLIVVLVACGVYGVRVVRRWHCEQLMLNRLMILENVHRSRQKISPELAKLSLEADILLTYEILEDYLSDRSSFDIADGPFCDEPTLWQVITSEPYLSPVQGQHSDFINRIGLANGTTAWDLERRFAELAEEWRRENITQHDSSSVRQNAAQE